MNWKHKIDLKFAGDMFDTEGFEATRNRICKTLWETVKDDWHDSDYDKEEFQEAVSNMEGAATVEEFNEFFDAFYDWADCNAVWVESF